jgi:hypothetical protein
VEQFREPSQATTLVTPAKAGVQTVVPLDSGFRRNDEFLNQEWRLSS